MISQKSASLLNITHAVYDIAKNVLFFYGSETAALELEFENNRYLSVEIGGWMDYEKTQ